MEQYVAAAIVKELRMGNNLPQLNQCLKSGGGNAEAKELCNRLTGIEKKINNTVRNLENGYSKALTDNLHLLEEERASLTNQLQTVSQAVPAITAKNLKATKRKLVEYLRTSDDPDVKELLRTHINEILVSNDSVTVDLHI